LHTTSRLAPLNRRDRRDRTTRDKGRTASASVATNRIGRQRGRDSRSVRVASGGGEGGEGGGFDGKIKDLNAEHGVVIYSKSWCPFCSEAKGIFDRLETEYFALELDEIDEGPDVQDALADITGIRTVPQVFVGGKLIGGCDDTRASLSAGELQKLVSEL